MRRQPLRLAVAAILATAFTFVVSPPGATGQPDQSERTDQRQREWREVFSPDGRISRVLVPKPVDPPLTTQDIAAAQAADVVAIRDTGAPSQRFDVAIVGDGYTSSQMDLLRQHAESKWKEIEGTAPWNAHTASVNVWLVKVVSAESGVDNDPTRGISRNTALDMNFWCDGIERLLCLTESKAKSYAAQAPGADAILAIGNTTKYGGAGYPSLATVAGGNAQAGRVAIHELGHSVGGLADEYFTPGTTHQGAEPTEPNVTRDSRGTKWSSYLGKNTPDGGTIGAYQGGYYSEFGIYRPSQDSLMRNINKPFNSIGLDVMDRAIRAKISGGTPTCTGLETTRTGDLTAGGSANQPDGSWFQTTVSGTHRACLDGPSGVNFDVALQKWSGSAWQTVASGKTTGPDETLSYTGSAGYYTYRVTSVSGAGRYTLGWDAP